MATTVSVLCWILWYSTTPHVSTIRLALCAVLKDPPNLEAWLRYHRDVMGVDMFYLRIEDSTSHGTLEQEAWAHCSRVTFAEGEVHYFDLMKRQIQHVDTCVQWALQDQITHMMHVDADELLYAPNGLDVFRDFIRNIETPVVINNLEAVFDRDDCTDPFGNATYFRTNRATFTSYANGKPLAVVHAKLKLSGPHRFKGKHSTVPMHTALVLHYESHCSDAWLRKFGAYANTDVNTADIPMPFYRDSIEALRKDPANRDVWQKCKMRKSDTSDLVRIILDV